MVSAIMRLKIAIHKVYKRHKENILIKKFDDSSLMTFVFVDHPGLPFFDRPFRPGLKAIIHHLNYQFMMEYATIKKGEKSE